MIDAAFGLLSIFAGIFLIWIAKHYDVQFGEASKTALILLPLLAYLIITGKLSEFELSGLKAKFKEINSEKISDTARAADLTISAPEANNPNFFLESFLQQCRPYYVIIEKFAKKNGVVAAAAAANIARSIRASLLCGKFEGLAVVDEKKKPIGFFPRSHFLEVLRLPLEFYGGSPPQNWAEKLHEEIMSTELGVVLSNPEARAKSEEAHKVSIPWNDHLQNVYKKIIENGVEVAMITDRHGRFDGIITRSAIESRVIGKLIEAAK